MELLQEENDDRGTECTVCMKVFIKPKLLPCYHSFCLICIEKLGDGKQPGDQCYCPLCRKEFEVPSGGLNFLPDNVFIQRMLGMGGNQSKESSTVERALCSICNDDDGETKMAQFTCITCLENMCTDCASHHRKMKLTRSHEVVPILEASDFMQKNMQTSTGQMSFCKIHSIFSINRFCYDCDLPLCWKCPKSDHIGHMCADLADVAERIESCVKTASTRTDESKKLCAQMVNDQKKVVDEMLEIEKRVMLEAEKIKRLVDIHASLLIAELEERSKKQVRELEYKKEKLKFNMLAIESLVKFGSLLLTRSTCFEFFRLSIPMEHRQKEIDQIIQNASYSLNCVKFSSGSTVDYFNGYGKNIVGQINTVVVNDGDTDVANELKENEKLQSTLVDVETLPTPDQSAATLPVLPDLSGAGDYQAASIEFNGLTLEKSHCSSTDDFQRIRCTGSVIALTGLKDKLLVLTKENDIRLNVYDLTSLNLQNQYSLTFCAEKTAKDMVVDVQKRRLYVSCTEGFLYVLTLYGSLIEMWKISNGSDGLYCTSTGSVLVTYRMIMKEYSCNGVLLKRIATCPYRKRFGFYVNHVISLDENTFIVCHGRDNDSERHGVLKLDSAGFLLGAYICPRNEDKVRVPIRMANDLHGGILLLDRQNNRVLRLYKYNLEFDSEVAKFVDENSAAVAMWFDDRRENLFIGLKSGVVLMRDISVFM